MLVFLSVVGMYQIYSGCWKYFLGCCSSRKSFVTERPPTQSTRQARWSNIYILFLYFKAKKFFSVSFLNSHSSPFSDWYLHHASWHFTHKNNCLQRCEELFVVELNSSSWLAFVSESESLTDVPLYQCIHVLLTERVWLLCSVISTLLHFYIVLGKVLIRAFNNWCCTKNH